MISAGELRNLKLFRLTSEQTLEALAKIMTRREVAAGETIVKEGQSNRELYLLSAGLVRVEKRLDDAGEITDVVARLDQGEFFGEMSFFDNVPHSTSVVAESPTTLFVLPRAELEKAMRQDAKLGMEQVLALFSGVCSRLRYTTRDLVTVIDMARIIGRVGQLEELLREVLERMRFALGRGITVSFYKWNPFNDEYFLIAVQGPARDESEAIIELADELLSQPNGEVVDVSKNKDGIFPLKFEAGHLQIARIDTASTREGLLVFYADKPHFFSLEDKQLIHTAAQVMCPAFVAARLREEEMARQLLERQRQTGFR